MIQIDGVAGYITWVIGVDPGLHGAAVVLDETGPVKAMMLPTQNIFGQERPVVDSFSSFLDLPVNGYAILCIEMVQAYGMMSSKKSIKSAGISWGMLAHAALVDPQILSVIAVDPKDWQKVMLKGWDGEDTKAKARTAVDALWPGCTLWPRVTKGADAGKVRDGIADAALIAEWARRHGPKGGVKP